MREVSIKSCLILGHGYTGQTLKKQISSVFPESQIHSTSRNTSSLLHFELENKNSWQNLPEVDATFWTFPAKPLLCVQKFLQAKSNSLGKIIVIGTTRSFLTTQVDERVNEETPLDLTMERVQGEEHIRNLGGITLCAAGIYGPGRNPVNWARKGRIQSSSKYLNLIHVEDLSRLLLAAYKKGKPKSIYLASDGSPRRWEELFNEWKLTSSNSPTPSQTKTSKFIDPSQTLQDLGVQLKYPSIAQGLDACLHSL